MKAITQPALLPSPAELGAPAKFDSWRKYQDQAVLDALSSTKRFVVAVMPTGSGKSLYAAIQQRMSGGRLAYLTSSKALQTQLMDDFSEVGMIDVKGQNNYVCRVGANEGVTVDAGPCHASYRCPYIESGCSYFDAVHTAAREDLVSTNYAFWMTQYYYGKGLGQFDTLVLDECFVAGTQVSGRSIETYHRGDAVTAFDDDSVSLATGQVSRVFRSRPDSLVRVHFANGQTLICTPGHPFYTRRGWCVARGLTPLLGGTNEARKEIWRTPDSSLRTLRQGVSCSDCPPMPSSPSRQTDLLLSRASRPCPTGASGQEDLQFPHSGTRVLRHDLQQSSTSRRLSEKEDSHAEGSSRCSIANADKEFNGESGDPGKDAPITDGAHLLISRGERPTDYSTTKARCGDLSGNRIPHQYPPSYEIVSKSSHLLQSGPRDPIDETCNRSGRTESSFEEVAFLGSQENGSVEFVGVDRVEVLEPTSDGTFGGLCPDGFVYNLEVERYHTYTANGFIVHNCHDAEAQLTSFLSVMLDHVDAAKVKRRLLSSKATIDDWRSWAKDGAQTISERIEDLEEDTKMLPADAGRRIERGLIREMKDLKELLKRLNALARAKGEWVIDYGNPDDRTKKVKFCPLNPAQYAEEFLFLGIKRIILTSATITPKTAERLGIPKDQMDYFEYPSTFPARNRPIIKVPCIRVNHRTTEEEMKTWDRRIDQIIGARLDRKGIIHTVSFARAQRVIKNSEWSDICYYNQSGNTRAVVEQFKEADAPAVLVSPSVSTGFDFVGKWARYQIIGKIPFPDTSSAIIQAWRKRDPDYEGYIAMQTMVQMAGRIVRSEIDKGETIILDDNLGWFLGMYGCPCGKPTTCRQMFGKKPRKHFAPKYFLDAVVWEDRLPEPLKLEE